MRKYMKYELKGTYRFMLAIILVVLVATSGIQIYTSNMLDQPSAPGGIFMALMGFAVFGAFIASIFYLIGNFRKELYEDRGYLTFTLPLSGNQILGAKAIIALMWSALLVISFLVYNILLARILHGEVIFTVIREGFQYISSLNLDTALTVYLIVFIFSVITTLLLIYFSIALSRVTIGNKKIGSIWVIVFLVLNSLIGLLSIKVAELIPFYIDISNFSIITESDFVRNLGNIESHIVGNYPGMAIFTSDMFALNVGFILFNILVAIGIYMGTSYLIEKKVDL
ncbi:MAG: hypothetical protein PHY91_07795 [Tissierellia bacterium]|nr:hypothetical protein [Tissierellia bacterium]